MDQCSAVGSEVALLKQSIELHYNAAKDGLSGLASGVAQHNFIKARNEHIGVAHERLIELLGPEEAIKCIATTIWSPEDMEVASPLKS